jgi:hypothetical protein
LSWAEVLEKPSEKPDNFIRMPGTVMEKDEDFKLFLETN